MSGNILLEMCTQQRFMQSNSSLAAFWLAKDAKFLLADNEDSNQTAQMHRLILF